MGGMPPWVRVFIFQTNCGCEHRSSHARPSQ
jgi:hypothetical protein